MDSFTRWFRAMVTKRCVFMQAKSTEHAHQMLRISIKYHFNRHKGTRTMRESSHILINWMPSTPLNVTKTTRYRLTVNIPRIKFSCAPVYNQNSFIWPNSFNSTWRILLCNINITPHIHKYWYTSTYISHVAALIRSIRKITIVNHWYRLSCQPPGLKYSF